MKIRDYNVDFIKTLPKTYEILSSGGFNVHAAVIAVSICGSRGLKKSYAADYDIDLWMEVDIRTIPTNEELAKDFLDSVLDTTLDNWQGHLPLDIFIAFDIADCGLHCLKSAAFKQCTLNVSMTDCFGVYRRNDNFRGFLNGKECRIEKLLPFMLVWRKN
ncbi:MAG: hypothetical protein FWF37_00650 [Chloroflexi bacterium]|nr:hypothetical protein [Chloroflexota bacterium]